MGIMWLANKVFLLSSAVCPPDITSGLLWPRAVENNVATLPCTMVGTRFTEGIHKKVLNVLSDIILMANNYDRWLYWYREISIDIYKA